MRRPVAIPGGETSTESESARAVATAALAPAGGAQRPDTIEQLLLNTAQPYVISNLHFRVVDPNKLNLDLDSGLWSNLDPDP